MIISHTYKYLFVELQNTSSTAISAELRKKYDGQAILHKHANYFEFLRIANAKEQDYFVFSCIRNPLDEAVSVYFKLKENHHEIGTNPRKWRKNGGWVDDKTVQLYDWVQTNNPDFLAFLRHVYTMPYDNWSCLSHRHFDCIIRFEDLQAGFSKVLNLLNIIQKGPLPLVNKTPKREHSFIGYYSPDSYAHAKKTFGLFMSRWGYSFSPKWGKVSFTPWNQLEFTILTVCRRIYWGYIQPSSSTFLKTLIGKITKQIKPFYGKRTINR